VIPHFADQAPVIEQVADSLPPGYDLVVKEHPMAIGRTPLQLLRRLARRPNVRLVDPRASTHELLRAADGVVVIGSTVGLEALLYFKPVLTLGDPFYAGYGVTMDVEPAELHEAVPALLKFRPDRDRILSLLHAAMARCMPGAPVLVDRSDENARVLAASLAANAEAERRAPSRVGVA
jgi:capsule polysaccharide export protein KpsC/LpsZ